MGPHKGTWSKIFGNMCLKSLIIVLIYRIPSLDVHVPVWSSQDALGLQKVV